MQINFWTDPAHGAQGWVPDGTFIEGIRSFRGTAANDYLTELRNAATACPSGTKPGGKIRVLAGNGYGDASFLIEYSHPETDVNGAPTGKRATRWISWSESAAWS